MQDAGIDPRVKGQFSLRARFKASGIPDADLDDLAGRVRSWDEWAPAWRDMGDRHRDAAERLSREGDGTRAGEDWLQASALYHFGSYLQQRGALRRTMRDSNAVSYRRALPLLDPPGQSMQVPFQVGDIPIWFRTPPGIEAPPVVLLIPGLDASKEEMHGLGEVAIGHGMAAIGVDGPGQGESEHLRFVMEFERVVGAVLDALPFRFGPVGVLGVSLGGFWAVRSGAFERRIAACVSVCGPFDWSMSIAGLVPLQRELWVWKAGIAEDRAAEEARRYELGSIVGRLSCPLLVVHAGRDTVISLVDGEALASAVPGSELVIYPESAHVCHDIAPEMRGLVMGWLAGKLM